MDKSFTKTIGKNVYNKDPDGYIRHLDGLRAIAVLLVLLFHFDVPLFKEGYLGVDIFFSISGYIITRNIDRSKIKNRFNLASFYFTRFFRLYPASTVVTFLTVLGSTLLLPYDQAKETCKSAVSSLIVSSNIFFHSFQNYFANDAKLKPLLHTWSLSLEEQFYFIWAPFLLLPFISSSSKTNCRKSFIFTFSLSLLSFIISLSLEKRHISFVFYHLPCRIFQFSLGASAYFFDNLSSYSESNIAIANGYFQSRWKINVIGRQLISSLNLSCLIILMTVFPHTYTTIRASLVSLSTAIIILQQNGIVAYILSSATLVFIGKHSYSAYLIHWPLFVFSRYLLLAFGKNPYHPLEYLFATFLFSILLKLFIEDPIRYGGKRIRAYFIIFAAFTLSSAVFGSLRKRPVPQEAMNELYIRTICKRDRDMRNIAAVKAGACMTGDLNGTTSKYVFIGNSFTRGLIPAIHIMGLKRSERYLVHHASRFAFCSSTLAPLNNLPKSVCSQGSSTHWKFMEHIPRGSIIVVCNHWFFDRANKVTAHINELSTELLNRNFSVVFVGEPPGIATRMRSKMNCFDFAEAYFWKLLAFISPRSASLCGNDTLKLPPVPSRIMERDVYSDLFPTSNSTRQFIDLFSPLCPSKKSSSDEYLCELPVLNHEKSTDSGYRPDGYHLSKAGALFYSSMIEKSLYK